MEKKRNVIEDESILASIGESSTDDYSNDGAITINVLKYIQDRDYVHHDINKIYARLKIRDHIRQEQSEWKEA